MSVNQLHANGGLGIDLGNDGVTADDTTDPDAGANGLQNRPRRGFLPGRLPGGDERERRRHILGDPGPQRPVGTPGHRNCDRPAGSTSEVLACITPTVCADDTVDTLTVTDVQVHETCGTLTVGPDVTVEGPSGFLTLRGRQVVLTNDVDVQTGGRLTIELTP